MIITQYILILLSRLYGIAVRTRKHLYRNGWLTHRPLDRPTICVGNITAGGTGKTPLCIYLMKTLRKKGFSPVLLLRGYRGKDGTCDEADIYRNRIPECPVGLGADRQQSLARFPDADFAVMDDGLQHISLRPDVRIVVVDALNPFDNHHLLPAGLLREPVSSIREYDIIVLSRTNLVDPGTLADLQAGLRDRFPEIPLFPCHQEIRTFLNVLSDAPAPDTDALSQTAPIAVCGIGNPDSFQCTLKQAGVDISEMTVFPDHHDFKKKDIERIRRCADTYDTSVVLTTEKDMPKLRPLVRDTGLTFYYSKLDTGLEDEEKFWQRVEELLEKRKDMHGEHR